MPTQSYEPLLKHDDVFQDEDEHSTSDQTLVNQNSARPKAPLRPHVYYGEGTFDPPSSDSDEEETLLEKGRTSPGTVERGFLPGENGLAPGLIVGGQKVCFIPHCRCHGRYLSQRFGEYIPRRVSGR